MFVLFRTQGRARGADSDEVRIMRKVFKGGVSTNVFSCVLLLVKLTSPFFSPTVNFLMTEYFLVLGDSRGVRWRLKRNGLGRSQSHQVSEVANDAHFSSD